MPTPKKLSVYKLKKMNDAMIKRMKAKRPNSNNWSGHGLGNPLVLSPPMPQDMKDYIGYTCDNKAWKNRTRSRSGKKQYNNHM